MPANSLLKNKYFDKLSLNRLKVNNLKVNKLFEKKHDCSCKSISYLFSLDLQKASWNSETNELTFSKSDALSLLRFTDRPYQFDKIFKDSDAVEYLDILFRSNQNGINSFEKDPPNGVLVAPEGQQAYNIKLQSVDDDGNVKLVLDLFKDTNGNYVSQLESFTDQKVSLFIDDAGLNCSGVIKGMTCRTTSKLAEHKISIIFETLLCNKYEKFSIKKNDTWIQVSRC